MEASTSVEIFCSYAHEDEPWLRKLETHLSVLKQQRLISLMYDRLISPGTDWDKTIDTHLETASVILLLVSADFFASDYCVGIEMKRALERQEAGEARVVPILVRPVNWKDAPFAHLQVLPTDAKPITQWSNRDQAFKNVVQGIKAALLDVQRLAFGTLPSPFPRLWNIPYSPNPFFTGQEALLTQLANKLKTGQPTALSQPQALSGLGGIGKTQIAVEYAYRHWQDYQAVFWVSADNHEALVFGYVELAKLLSLPEKNERDQMIIVQAVLQWLKTHKEWLLILDNADDLSLISLYLRSLLGGHILLTTRAQAVGSLAQHIEVKTMNEEAGALLLLRRAGLIGLDASLETVSTSERAIAQKIAEDLGGLPLALDQAGAYIEETGCSLASYLQMYQQRRMELLKRRGGISSHYPESVATTWVLSFEKIKQQSPAAVDLLRCCALLHPDAIPEELFMNGAIHLGSRLQRVGRSALAFHDTIRVLLAYSLIHRERTTSTLSIHRLVQAFLIHNMSTKTRKLWLERLIVALNAVFPNAKPGMAFVEIEQWGRLVSHTLACIALARSWKYANPNLDLAALLMKAVACLYLQMRYAQAEPLCLQSLDIYEQVYGSAHSDVAFSLQGLALIYKAQGKDIQAEQFFQRALTIYRRQADHSKVAGTLTNLAILYHDQGKYAQAEQLFQQALTIWEQVFGSDHFEVAYALDGLAGLYLEQDRLMEAEQLSQRALVLWEQHLGAENHFILTGLTNLAELYRRQGKYELAESFYQRALTIRGLHPFGSFTDAERDLKSVAELYQSQGKYELAEPTYQRALTIQERQLGSTHPETQKTREAYAAFLRLVGRDAEATMLETGYIEGDH